MKSSQAVGEQKYESKGSEIVSVIATVIGRETSVVL